MEFNYIKWYLEHTKLTIATITLTTMNKKEIADFHTKTLPLVSLSLLSLGLMVKEYLIFSIDVVYVKEKQNIQNKVTKLYILKYKIYCKISHQRMLTLFSKYSFYERNYLEIFINRYK